MHDQGPILVVDDQVGVRKLLAEVLGSLGYEVKLASSGEEAVDFVRETPPRLIVLDMKMPGMSGLEVISEVKKLKCHSPIILMTAYGELEIVSEAKKLGVEHYINKPFDVHKMRELVKNVLEGKAGEENIC